MHEAMKMLNSSNGMLDDDAPFGMGSIGDLLGVGELRRGIVLRLSRFRSKSRY